MGFGGPVPTPFNPGVGGGAADARIQVPGYQGSGADQMNSAFDSMRQGIDMRNNMLMKNKELAQQQAQYKEKQAFDEKKLALDTEMNQQKMAMEQEKFATLQKQQMIQQQRDMEKAERDRVKGEMDLIDWKNEQAAQEVLMKNLSVVDKLLNEGIEDAEVYNSPEYKATLAALFIVDPKAASSFFSDAQKRRYEASKNTREVASYNVVAPIYTEGFPQAMEGIQKGKPITDAIRPVKEKLDRLYRTGQLNPTVYKQTLKDYIDLVQTSMKKLNGAMPDTYKTYDAAGNLTADPTKVTRQVSTKTGKVSTVGGAPDYLQTLLEEDTEEAVAETPEKEDNLWRSLFGGD